MNILEALAETLEVMLPGAAALVVRAERLGRPGSMELMESLGRAAAAVAAKIAELVAPVVQAAFQAAAAAAAAAVHQRVALEALVGAENCEYNP